MGSVFGAALASAGADTLLVDVSEPLVNRLNNEGVVVRTAQGEQCVQVAATSHPKSPPVDLVIVFVKSWATDSALTLIRPLLGAQTVVVSLQNGLGNGDRISQHVDANRVLVGVTYHSATVVGLGVVDHTVAGTTYLGPHTGTNPEVAASVATFLSASGLPTEATPDIGTRIWRKLMLNLAANPVAALTGLRSGRLIEVPGVASLMDAITREAVTVARAAGQELDFNETIDYVHDSLRKAGSATASMRQDVQAGRRTEIDVITGALTALADHHGIEAPLNRAIQALVEGYEATLTDTESPDGASR
jgi:2-dehydropantoate 2-reductase